MWRGTVPLSMMARGMRALAAFVRDVSTVSRRPGLNPAITMDVWPAGRVEVYSVRRTALPAPCLRSPGPLAIKSTIDASPRPLKLLLRSTSDTRFHHPISQLSISSYCSFPCLTSVILRPTTISSDHRTHSCVRFISSQCLDLLQPLVLHFLHPRLELLLFSSSHTRATSLTLFSKRGDAFVVGIATLWVAAVVLAAGDVAALRSTQMVSVFWQGLQMGLSRVTRAASTTTIADQKRVSTLPVDYL